MEKSRFAEPDPDVEASKMDLGVLRRDHIVQYTSGVTAREERAQRLQAREEADARRKSRETAAANGDQNAARLSAWHNATNITADPAALVSADIAGGQSHRAGLTARIQSGQVRDFDDDFPRGGRRPAALAGPSSYATNRDVSGGNYVAVKGVGAGPSGYPRTSSSSTPRGLQSAPIPTNSSAGRTAPLRPDGHVRPPSPRALGTVRFGAGGRRTERPSSTLLGEQSQPATARPVVQGASAAPRTTSSSAISRTATGAASPLTRPTSSASSPAPRPSISSASQARQTSAASATSTTSSVRTTLGPRDPELWTQRQPEDYIRRQQLQYKATLYAALQGTQAEQFARSGTEAAGYLQEARRRLINEVTGLAKRMDTKEIDGYITAHGERKWMVAAARKARELLEHGSNEEVAAHYDENKAHLAFFQTAVALEGSQRDSSTNTRSPVTSKTSASSLPSATSASASFGAAQSQSVSAATQARTPSNSLSMPSSPVPSVAATAVSSAASAASASSASTVHAQRQTSNIVTSSGAAQVAGPDRVPAATTNGTTVQPNGSVSTASSRSSLRSAATDITIPPRRGIVNVTFFGSNGNFLQHEQVRTEAPVSVNLSINSTDVNYDPRVFFAALRAAVEGTAAGPADRARSVGGMVQAADGVWESDEEL